MALNAFDRLIFATIRKSVGLKRLKKKTNKSHVDNEYWYLRHVHTGN